MKKLPLLLLVLILVVPILILRPVDIGLEQEAMVVYGLVGSIEEGGQGDVVIHLVDDPHIYYINRGLDAGLNLELLRSDFLGQAVTIKYPRHWTLLDPGGRVKHLSKIESEGKVVYSEWD